MSPFFPSCLSPSFLFHPVIFTCFLMLIRILNIHIFSAKCSFLCCVLVFMRFLLLCTCSCNCATEWCLPAVELLNRHFCLACPSNDAHILDSRDSSQVSLFTTGFFLSVGFTPVLHYSLFILNTHGFCMKSSET